MSGHAQRRRPALAWRLGMLLLLAGLSTLVYAGGLYANSAYEQLAARGDNSLVPSAVEILSPTGPSTLMAPLPQQPVPQILPDERDAGSGPLADLQLREPGQRRAAELRDASRPGGDTAPAASPAAPVAPPAPSRPAPAGRSLITRVTIPRIGVDSKVVEVGWDVVEEQGQQVAVWQVAKYAVGQHRGSANPGEGNNIVLAGHVGGAAPVFRDLIQLEPGDELTLVSQGQEYRYVVREKLLVQEVGVPLEQRLENGRLLGPTPDELLTLVTCWPNSGPNKFEQRVVIRAVPQQDASAAGQEQPPAVSR